jgi:hypothetical protein
MDGREMFFFTKSNSSLSVWEGIEKVLKDCKLNGN